MFLTSPYLASMAGKASGTADVLAMSEETSNMRNEIRIRYLENVETEKCILMGD